MLRINDDITIPAEEIDISAIRAQGAGGQNVNKVSTAIHLRFDINGSTALPDDVRARLLGLRDQRINKDGVVIIKAQRFRSRDKNRDDALQRLAELIRSATIVPRARRKTKPTRQSREKRLEEKAKRSKLKQLRSKPID